MDTNKKIQIEGQSNRYFIKKVNREKKQELLTSIPKHEFLDDFELPSTQMSIVQMIYLTQEDPLYAKEISCVKQKIRTKMNSYLQQDKLKNRLCFDTQLTCNDIYELILSSKGKCYYCNINFVIHYVKYRDVTQWTLERIDNDMGHCKSNCVIAWLQCNLQRRNRNMQKFKTSKSLVIVRKDLEICQPI